MRNTNGGRWLTVHAIDKNGHEYAYVLNLAHVVSIRQNGYESMLEGRNATIQMIDGNYIKTTETVKELESEIRWH